MYSIQVRAISTVSLFRHVFMEHRTTLLLRIRWQLKYEQYVPCKLLVPELKNNVTKI